jgi:hypothetical protein
MAVQHGLLKVIPLNPWSRNYERHSEQTIASKVLAGVCIEYSDSSFTRIRLSTILSVAGQIGKWLHLGMWHLYRPSLRRYQPRTLQTGRDSWSISLEFRTWVADGCEYWHALARISTLLEVKGGFDGQLRT